MPQDDTLPPAHASHTRQLARLRRIEGQVRGVAAMIENGRYCVDILTQLQATRAALARVERDILDDHASACVASAVALGDPALQREKMEELTELLRRALK
ncbi:metal-sensitive transcriptional regulator [Sphingomonas sp.]|uniref:metal-sensitive transcriptional regulator n=1 Tax=Sphingomonas sp. TaxID=28214 RepID=UPI0035BC4292